MHRGDRLLSCRFFPADPRNASRSDKGGKSTGRAAGQHAAVSYLKITQALHLPRQANPVALYNDLSTRLVAPLVLDAPFLCVLPTLAPPRTEAYNPLKGSWLGECWCARQDLNLHDVTH